MVLVYTENIQTDTHGHQRSRILAGPYWLRDVGLTWASGFQLRAVVLGLTIGHPSLSGFILSFHGCWHALDGHRTNRSGDAPRSMRHPLPSVLRWMQKLMCQSIPKNQIYSHASIRPPGTEASFPLLHQCPDRGLEAFTTQQRGEQLFTIGYAGTWVQGV